MSDSDRIELLEAEVERLRKQVAFLASMHYLLDAGHATREEHGQLLKLGRGYERFEQVAA